MVSVARGRSQRHAIYLLSAGTLIHNLGTNKVWDETPKTNLISNHAYELYEGKRLISKVELEMNSSQGW